MTGNVCTMWVNLSKSFHFYWFILVIFQYFEVIGRFMNEVFTRLSPSQNTSLFSFWIPVNPRFWRLKKFYKKTLFFREVFPRINNENRQCLNCLLGITGAHKSQSPRQYVIWMHWEHLGITSHHFRISLHNDTLPMQRCCEDFFLVHQLFCLHFG